MQPDEYITVRVKPEIKAGAQAILKEMGMSTSEAIDLFLTYIALKKSFPSDLHIPNETSLKAFQDSESGKNMKTFATLDELYQDLGI
jgi:DNA-damage-inducible protein J